MYVEKRYAHAPDGDGEEVAGRVEPHRGPRRVEMGDDRGGRGLTRIDRVDSRGTLSDEGQGLVEEDERPRLRQRHSRDDDRISGVREVENRETGADGGEAHVVARRHVKRALDQRLEERPDARALLRQDGSRQECCRHDHSGEATGPHGGQCTKHDFD
jgi:hypothetical protein